MDNHTHSIDDRTSEADEPIRRGFVDRRQEEAESFNNLLSRHLPHSIQSWTCDEEGWKFEYSDMIIAVNNDEFGALSVHANSMTMPRKFLDAMRVQLRQTLEDICEVDFTPTGFAVKLLELCEEAASWEETWQKHLLEKAVKEQSCAPGLKRKLKQAHGWNPTQIESYESIIDNPFGVNLSTVEDTGQSLLGKSITDICFRISEDIRILHVEPVFRNDLVAKFNRRKTRMRNHLRSMPYGALRQSVSPEAIPRGSRDDNMAGLTNELNWTHVTIHGAPRRVIESIVRYGFTLPGEEIGETGKELQVRCGSTYGMGIYSSPDPMYASMYLDYNYPTNPVVVQPADVPGMRLLVCATLMGRPMERQLDQRRKQGHAPGLLSDQAHSHVSPNQLEYVVFDNAQIIPVYVLHLDYGAEVTRAEFDRIANDPAQFFQTRRQTKTVNKWGSRPELCPGEIQRKKEAIKAAASKWFPYGYGPAQRINFVIEEIAEISDDEEVYGDFQHQRIEREREIQEHIVEEGSSWFDEFQTVRRTNHDVKVIDI
jgi:hypothetical protein